jgi:hypothetical protein
MPKSKKPPEKPKDQFKRFLETATKRGVSSDADVDAAFRKLAKGTKPKSPSRSSRP